METEAKVAGISFILGIVISIIVIPILRKLKIGQIERDDGPQSHLKKQGTPTMGGVISAIVLIIMTIVICIIKRNAGNEFIQKIVPLMLTCLGFGLIGFIDDAKKMIFKDTKGLKPSYKMAGLLIISVLYISYIVFGLKIGTETYIPFVKQFINIPVWLYIPFAIFVLLGTTNAVNLTDGVDGLATTVTTIIITALTVIGIRLNMPEVSLLGSIFIGANLGFLVFNLYPAKVIMGDTGSLLLGGLIAGIALYIKMPFLLVILALVPIIETVSVMMQVFFYKKTGKRIFKMAPIHHHFELCGWNENTVVSVFSVVTFILSIIALKAI